MLANNASSDRAQFAQNGNSQPDMDGNEYDMSEEQQQQYLMNDMVMNRAFNMLNSEKENGGQDSSEEDDNITGDSTLLRSQALSPSSMLAQVFNKSTLAAMGLDTSMSNNAAAIAATIAASFNYGQANVGGTLNSSLSGGTSSSSGSSGTNKPKPPALARVSCHICRKELCNKYFLKSHLLNAHQITADDFLMNSLTDSQSGNAQSNEKKPIGKSTKLRREFADEDDEAESSGELEEGQQTTLSDNEESERTTTDAEMIAAKQNMMSFSALLNYNKILNGDTSLQTSQTAAAAAAAAALMAAASTSSNADEVGSSFGSACNMQPFLFECQEEAFSANFVPCMVYLPVKSKLSSSITVKVTLKPLDQSLANPTAHSSKENGSVNESGDENDQDVDDLEDNSQA